MTCVYGNGMPGFNDGGSHDSQFDCPQGMVYYHGDLYVADTNNHAIRKVPFLKVLSMLTIYTIILD